MYEIVIKSMRISFPELTSSMVGWSKQTPGTRLKELLTRYYITVAVLVVVVVCCALIDSPPRTISTSIVRGTKKKQNHLSYNKIKLDSFRENYGSKSNGCSLKFSWKNPPELIIKQTVVDLFKCTFCMKNNKKQIFNITNVETFNVRIHKSYLKH